MSKKQIIGIVGAVLVLIVWYYTFKGVSCMKLI